MKPLLQINYNYCAYTITNVLRNSYSSDCVEIIMCDQAWIRL